MRCTPASRRGADAAGTGCAPSCCTRRGMCWLNDCGRGKCRSKCVEPPPFVSAPDAGPGSGDILASIPPRIQTQSSLSILHPVPAAAPLGQLPALIVRVRAEYAVVVGLIGPGAHVVQASAALDIFPHLARHRCGLCCWCWREQYRSQNETHGDADGCSSEGTLRCELLLLPAPGDPSGAG